MLGAIFLGRQAVISGKKVQQNQQYLITVEKLAELAGQLEDEGSDQESKELFSMAGQSVKIKDYNLQKDIINTGIAYAYTKLKSKNMLEVRNYLDKVKISNNNNSLESLQIRLLKLKIQGNLSYPLQIKLSNYQKQTDSFENTSQENIKVAIIHYSQAFEVIKTIKYKSILNNKEVSPPFNSNIENKIISKENIEAFYREFITLLSVNNENKKLKQEVEKSLQEHYYDELENLLANQKWQEANEKTEKLMVYIVNPEFQYYPSYLKIEDIKNLSCENLNKINSLWLKYSHENFGFSVQKNIWLDLGNKLNITEKDQNDEKANIIFGAAVGWYDNQKKQWRNYNELIRLLVALNTKLPKGSLPTLETSGQRLACKYFPLCSGYTGFDEFGGSGLKQIFSRVAACKIK